MNRVDTVLFNLCVGNAEGKGHQASAAVWSAAEPLGAVFPDVSLVSFSGGTQKQGRSFSKTHGATKGQKAGPDPVAHTDRSQGPQASGRAGRPGGPHKGEGYRKQRDPTPRGVWSGGRGDLRRTVLGVRAKLQREGPQQGSRGCGNGTRSGPLAAPARQQPGAIRSALTPVVTTYCRCLARERHSLRLPWWAIWARTSQPAPNPTLKTTTPQETAVLACACTTRGLTVLYRSCSIWQATQGAGCTDTRGRDQHWPRGWAREPHLGPAGPGGEAGSSVSTRPHGGAATASARAQPPPAHCRLVQDVKPSRGPAAAQPAHRHAHRHAGRGGVQGVRWVPPRGCWS